jgi:cytochrome c biogenesis protein
MGRLASTRLTLWLLGILAAAMAMATIIPQNAPTEAYLRAFGTVLGPLVAKTALRSIYGSWWFVGAFCLLALNLFACSVRRTGQLLGQGQQTPSLITREEVLARPERARWRVNREVQETVRVLASAFRRRRYQVVDLPGEAGDQRGLLARRGRLAPWAPVVVHVGMLIVLIGAGWGRLPRNAFRTVASLPAGGTFPVRVGDDAFTLRLNDAGTERDAAGKATDYWAKVEVLEEGHPVRSTLVRPNHPLRYHGISITLQSLSEAGPPHFNWEPVGWVGETPVEHEGARFRLVRAGSDYRVEVVSEGSREYVPVVLLPNGEVDIMSTIRRLERPAWAVFVHQFRSRDERGQQAAAAKVFVDHSGGVTESGAQLSLDRDIGIPIVYLGFIVMTLGSVLTLGGRRRSLIALVTSRRQGSQVLVGASRAVGGGEVGRLLKQLQSELGGVSEAEQPRKEEVP